MAKAATATANKPATAKGDRIAPVITAISTAVKMPEVQNKRGSTTSYPFDKLEVGASFGVKNKTVKQLSSIISNQNRKPGPPAVNPDGSPKFKMINLTDASGAVIGQQASKERETDDENKKHFFAVDVDAKTDPDGVSVRVFRDK